MSPGNFYRVPFGDDDTEPSLGDNMIDDDTLAPMLHALHPLLDGVESEDSGSEDESTINLAFECPDTLDEALPLVRMLPEQQFMDLPEPSGLRTSRLPPPLASPSPTASGLRTRHSLQRNRDAIVEYEACPDSEGLIFAFFRNVPANYAPVWPSILSSNADCFGNLVRVKSNPTVSYVFEMTAKGRQKFRGSRKSAIWGIGGMIVRLNV